MRIVLSGYYGFDNVGDEAILYAIIHSLRDYCPEIKITVLSNKPEKTAAVYQVEAVDRWNINEVRKALKSSDGLISGGGSLLQDETGRKSIPYYAGIMKIAQFLKKPVFVYAQGMGPVSSTLNRMIMKNVLQKAEMLSVRDKHSKQLLETIGVTQPIHIVPDPVMGIDSSNFKNGWKEAENLGRRVISVSIRDWTNDLSYLEEVAAGLDTLAEKDYEILLVPMHGKHDLKASERVRSKMKKSADIFPFDSSIEEKMAVIKDSDVLLGMRLHALIFSSVGCTPFVALSYDPKIDSFAEIVDQKVIGNVSSKDWNSNDIVQSIEKVFADYPAEMKKLKQNVEPLQKKANETAKKVIDALMASEKKAEGRNFILASSRNRNR